MVVGPDDQIMKVVTPCPESPGQWPEYPGVTVDDLELLDDYDDLEFDRFGVAAGDTSTQVWEVFDCRDPVVFCHRRFFSFLSIATSCRKITYVLQ